MIDLILLKLLLNKEHYKNYFQHVDLSHIKEHSVELFYVYNTLVKAHQEFDKDLTLDELRAYFDVLYPDASKGVYQGLFDSVASLDVSEQVAQNVVQQIQQNKLLLKLSEIAYAVSQGRRTVEELKAIVQEAVADNNHEEILGDEETFVQKSLSQLINGVVATPGIRWPLNCLNKSLGSLRKGDFGFVFARPETGKTTFLAHVVGHALDQVQDAIIIFNNEEVDEKVILRIYQSYFNATLHELMQDIGKYEAEFQQRVGDKLKFVNSSQVEISKTSVENILSKTKCNLIIFDQLDKVIGFKADRDDLVYGEIYQWARELAKKYAPIMGICQAAGTAENQKWLTMEHVALAKTSKQAEADWIIGVGCVHEESMDSLRFLNISKNKLVGDQDSIPALRHGRFQVQIDKEHARYVDIVNYG